MITIKMKFEPNVGGIMKEIAASEHVDINAIQGTVSGPQTREWQCRG